jgi:hypothetical protein
VGVECCGNNGLSPLGYLCVDQQTTSVSNSTNTVNFTASPAPYQITGHLRDAGGNPIANVGVSADHDAYHVCATSASDGSYTLYVTNSTWHVYPDCNDLSALGYLCPGDLQVTVLNANVVLEIIAPQAAYTISGWVKNTSNQPFANVDVYAYTTIGTNSYQSGRLTDGNGNYSLPVADSQWFVGVDCNDLGGGYLCPNELTINIAGASVVTNFTIQPCGQLQILTTSPLPAGQVGAYYDFQLQASSCYPNFGWSLSSGSGPLPPGLELDPSGELYGMPETNGTFSFTVAVADGNSDTTNKSLSLTIAPPPQDVLTYSITKMKAFRQSDATTLVPDNSHGPFSATLSIIQSAPDNVPIANVYLASGLVRGFPWGRGGIELQTKEYFTTETNLDAVYPNGNYTFGMATRNNGFQFPELPLLTMVYPAAPRVSNYAAAQAIDPASPFILQWVPPAGATTNDFIWVFIMNGSGNMVFSTPYPPTNYLNSLRGTATSVEIPTNTCQVGSTNTGIIVFFRVTGVNTAAYPGAVGMTLVGVDTAFPMAAPSASLPVLSQPTRISSTQFGFLLSGVPGQNYTVLSATNVARPLSNWATLLTTTLSSNSAFVQDNQAMNKQRFYRVKVGP